MHRIDTPGATPDNKFTDGNKALGTPATIVDDDWLNSIQEELVAVILGAGSALDKENTAQLLGALQLLFAAKAGAAGQAFSVAAAIAAAHAVRLDQFAHTIAGGSGTLQLPGGLLVNAGSTIFPASIATAPWDVVFPVAFSTNPFVVASIGVNAFDYDAYEYRLCRQAISVAAVRLEGFDAQVFMDNYIGHGRVANYLAFGK